ncbi:MAG: hypothetical protein AB7O93_20150 [Vicinamibacterales bacterium]
MRLPPFAPLAAAAAALWLGAAGLAAQRSDAFPDSRYHPNIRYSSTAPTDAVAQLNARLERGDLRLTFDPTHGYLESVLQALGLDPSSQTLVYSGTSLQASYIKPDNPRAIYFGDNVAVAWIRGAPLLELAAQDPRLGTVFYQLSQTDGAAPRASRMETCLSCHLSWDTRAVPGVFVLTTFPRKSDSAYADGGVSDHREPLNRRYGGWYVTGDKVPPRHMGNQPLIFPGAAPPEQTPAPALRTTLAGTGLVRDIDQYLRPTSDIVALVVLEHQLHAMNLMTRTAWEHRLVAGASADAPVAPGDEPVLTPRVKDAVDELVDYLLFVDEVPLGTIKGNSGFAEWFQAQGPKDPAGRSLRDLKLDGRLMRYPLSYTIYSTAFAGMPPAVRQAVYRRLWTVLTSPPADTRYAHLAAADRQAILEILRATRSDLPAVFDTTLAAR